MCKKKGTQTVTVKCKQQTYDVAFEPMTDKINPIGMYMFLKPDEKYIGMIYYSNLLDEYAYMPTNDQATPLPEKVIQIIYSVMKSANNNLEESVTNHSTN